MFTLTKKAGDEPCFFCRRIIENGKWCGKAPGGKDTDDEYYYIACLDCWYKRLNPNA